MNREGRINTGVQRLALAIEAMDDIYAEHMTGQAFSLHGERYCGLPKNKADLLYFLIDTALRDVRELRDELEQSELEAAPMREAAE